MHTRRCWGAADRMDVAFVMLGVNDCSGVAIQPDSAREQSLDLLLAQCRTLVAAILDPECGYPGCRVVLALTPIGCNTPEAYAGGLEFMTRYEAAVRGLWERLLREFDGNPAHPRVRVAIAGLMADRDLGYSKAERRVDGEIRLVHNNAVHPNETGYRQSAAACYSTLRGWLADEPIGAAPREAVSRRIQSPDVDPTRNQEAR